MFIQDDNTYNNLREKSFLQWLDDCSNNEIKRLKEQNELKNEYLKKISGKK